MASINPSIAPLPAAHFYEQTRRSDSIHNHGIELAVLNPNGRNEPPPAYSVRPPETSFSRSLKQSSWQKKPGWKLGQGLIIAGCLVGAGVGGWTSRAGAIHALDKQVDFLKTEVNLYKTNVSNLLDELDVLSMAQPIYSRLRTVTPVAAYNTAYNTSYSDDYRGRQDLFAAASVPFRSFLQVPTQNGPKNCSIRDLMVFGQDIGSDLILLANEAPEFTRVGLNYRDSSDPQSEIKYTGEFLYLGSLNKTGTRGPQYKSLFPNFLYYNYGGDFPHCEEDKFYSFNITQGNSPLDSENALVLASPKNNGSHSGFLLAFDDGSQEFNQFIFQIGAPRIEPDLEPIFP